MMQVLALALVFGVGATTVAVDVPMPAPSRPIEILEEALVAPDAKTRSRAAWELAGAARVSADAMSRLEALREDPDRAVRYGATWALQHLANRDGQYDTPPVPKRMTKPTYPRSAFQDKVEGVVVLSVLPGETGEIAHVRVKASIPALDDAAVKCVREWRFKPATRAGKAVPLVVEAPVGFRIE